MNVQRLMRQTLLGGQWALVICSWLLNGKLRFGELKKIAQYHRSGC